MLKNGKPKLRMRKKGSKNSSIDFTIKDEWFPISLGYTSGTTSKPKGVVTHHRGAYLNAHVDRPSCEISTTICLDYKSDDNSPWKHSLFCKLFDKQDPLNASVAAFILKLKFNVHFNQYIIDKLPKFIEKSIENNDLQGLHGFIARASQVRAGWDMQAGDEN